MQHRGMRWALAIFAAAALGLAGCSDDAAPAAGKKKGESKNPFKKVGGALGKLEEQRAQREAEDAAKNAAAAPPPAVVEGDEDISDIAYAYSPVGKRDPFRSLFDLIGRDESEDVKTELQKFEVDQLKLVAIVSRIATPYAMVEDPKGKGHTLTRGTLIGKHWGRVSQIKPGCVVIKEEYPDYTGRKVTNKSSICLPKDQELKID